MVAWSETPVDPYETPTTTANGSDEPPPGFFEDGAPAPAVDEPKPDAWTALVTPAPEDWFTEPPPPRTWLLRDARAGGAGVLPLGTVGQLVAEGGAGKTMLLAQLAVAVATGTRWLDALDVVASGRVLLALGEEDVDEVRRRLYRARRAVNAPTPPPDSIVTLPLRSVTCALVESDENGNPRDTAFGLWLRAFVASGGPWALVAVDPLSRFAGLDAETDNAAGTRYVQALERFASYGPTVLGSHHTNKLARGPGGKVDAHSARGSSSIVDGPRWVATLARERFDHGDANVNARLGEVVTLGLGVKSNVSRTGASIELRRDDDNGGALVPLDESDRELVKAARTGAVARRATTAQRETDREQTHEMRERKDTERRRASAVEREEATRRRDADDDAAARELLSASPDARVRVLVARLKAARACGSTRALAAMHRVREAP